MELINVQPIKNQEAKYTCDKTLSAQSILHMMKKLIVPAASRVIW